MFCQTPIVGVTAHVQHAITVAACSGNGAVGEYCGISGAGQIQWGEAIVQRKRSMHSSGNAKRPKVIQLKFENVDDDYVPMVGEEDPGSALEEFVTFLKEGHRRSVIHDWRLHR